MEPSTQVRKKIAKRNRHKWMTWKTVNCDKTREVIRTQYLLARVHYCCFHIPLQLPSSLTFTSWFLTSFTAFLFLIVYGLLLLRETVHWIVFFFKFGNTYFKTLEFLFGNNFKITESCKSSTQNRNIPFTQIHLLLTFCSRFSLICPGEQASLSLSLFLMIFLTFSSLLSCQNTV